MKKSRDLFVNGRRVGPLLVAVGLAGLIWQASAEEGLRIVFPEDKCVIDVRRDFGAAGDGMTDDTEALQAALDAGSGADIAGHRIVYLPNGVYRVTQTLVVNSGRNGSGLGPWLYGESRDRVVIRLDDGVEGVTSVLRTHPKDEGKTSANWFMRTVRNLTIDAGDNPQTDGVRWFASNSGLLKDVVIRGNGPRGVNSSFLGENGPNMMQDVVIQGFETGVFSRWFYGQTLSRVTIENCQKLGVDVLANSVGIEDLIVRNTPQAVAVRIKDNAHWWAGSVAIVGGEFSTTASDLPAITGRGNLFVRDLTTDGFANAIESEEGKVEVEGPDVFEYTSKPVVTLFEGTSTASPRLKTEREPEEWEPDLTKWLCANDFGITFGDRSDDTKAFQAAFDEAARLGATTVYIRGVEGGDPNWYSVEGEVRIHGSVRHVIALGFGRILGGGTGRFVIDDSSAEVVAFRHIDSLGGRPIALENRSRDRTLYAESCSVEIVGNGQGKIFATNVPAHLRLLRPGQPCWVRSLNAEGSDPSGLVQNNGGKLWVLGTKSEGDGPRFITRQGGTTEIFGAYEYATKPIQEGDRAPIFWSEDSTVFAAGVFEVSFTGKPYEVKLRDVRQGELRELDRPHIQRDKLRWHFLSTRPGSSE